LIDHFFFLLLLLLLLLPPPVTLSVLRRKGQVWVQGEERVGEGERWVHGKEVGEGEGEELVTN